MTKFLRIARMALWRWKELFDKIGVDRGPLPTPPGQAASAQGCLTHNPARFVPYGIIPCSALAVGRGQNASIENPGLLTCEESGLLRTNKVMAERYLMKLWYSPASPFVRKCLILAHERDLADKIELVDAAANVVNPDQRIVASNPSGKIPTMVLEDGTVLFDSRVICAYLDSIHNGKKLTPRSGPKRFEVMTLEALGDGIMDAAVNNRYETAMRPAEFQWKPWSDGQMGKVNDSLDQIEAKWLKSLGRVPNMGSIAVAAALGYLEFRYPDLKWRKERKGLARWFKRFSERPSFIASKPD